MHDSFNAMGGVTPMLQMQLGEVVYGGVGSGLYGMLAFAVLAVFIAGLMIGRTPEYLGKKIEAYDMKMVSIVIRPRRCWCWAAPRWPCRSAPARRACSILASTVSRNPVRPDLRGQQQRQRLRRPVRQHALLQRAAGAAMWFGCFAIIVAVLAMAGSLAAKRRLPAGPGSMPTHGPLFVVLLIGAVLLVRADLRAPRWRWPRRRAPAR